MGKLLIPCNRISIPVNQTEKIASKDKGEQGQSARQIGNLTGKGRQQYNREITDWLTPGYFSFLWGVRINIEETSLSCH